MSFPFTAERNKKQIGCMGMLQAFCLKKTGARLKKSLRAVYLQNPLTGEVNGAFS